MMASNTSVNETALNRLRKMQIAPTSVDDEKNTAAASPVGAKGSVFGNVPVLPPDAIFHVKTAYSQDKSPQKLNLGIGAYRTEAGKPYVLNIVKRVEADMLADVKAGRINKEYLPIGGDNEFIGLSQKLILGDCAAVREGRVAGVQALSGTGALRLCCNFIKQFFPSAVIYKSSPTWGNHRKIIMKAGLAQRNYRYFDPKTRGLDIEGMIEDLSAAAPGSVVLLHACAHNPTGVDPSRADWGRLADLCQKRKLIPFFDCAYQGYATGDLEADRFAVELFEKRGMEMMIAQSYSKNMGLYGERVGCASIVCRTAAATKAANTQLRGVVRPMYSNPPKHGAYIAKRILGNPQYYAAWKEELQAMSDRILQMRTELRTEVERLGVPGTWNHITDQIGMFTFTGLTKDQVLYMRKKYAIYFLESGRISIAGLSSNTVPFFAKAMHDAVLNA